MGMNWIMTKIKVIGNYRGFLKDLFNTAFPSITFEYKSNKKFELLSKRKEFLLRLYNHPFFDFLGLFVVRDVKESDAQYYFSYNRFLNIPEGKYVIYLENPTALVNYSDTKMKSRRAKNKLKRLFKSESLLKIVCMSKACFDGMTLFYPDIPLEKITQLYPLIQEDSSLHKSQLTQRARQERVKCLYVSSQFRLKGGEDLLAVFERFSDCDELELTIVTDCSKLTEEQAKRIQQLPNVHLKEFNLNRNELFALYQESNILLNPSRMDSFSLVTLEAVKNGCVVISSDIYAIKEMVIDGWNGFLQLPKYQFWNEDGSINHYVKVNPSKTYDSEYLDDQMIDFLYEKISLLIKDREVLLEMSQNSLDLAMNDTFSSQKIKEKWENILSQES